MLPVQLPGASLTLLPIFLWHRVTYGRTTAIAMWICARRQGSLNPEPHGLLFGFDCCRNRAGSRARTDPDNFLWFRSHFRALFRAHNGFLSEPITGLPAFVNHKPGKPKIPNNWTENLFAKLASAGPCPPAGGLLPAQVPPGPVLMLPTPGKKISITDILSELSL